MQPRTPSGLNRLLAVALALSLIVDPVSARAWTGFSQTATPPVATEQRFQVEALNLLSGLFFHSEQHLNDEPSIHLANLRSHTGPGASGQNWQRLIPKMLVAGRPNSPSVAVALISALYRNAHSLPYYLWEALNITEATMGLEPALVFAYPGWLSNTTLLLRDDIGLLISHAVRFRLRLTSTLSARDRSFIQESTYTWMQEHGFSVELQHQGRQTIIVMDLPLDNGPAVKFEWEAVQHAASASNGDYLNAINLPLGVDPRDLEQHYAVLQEYREGLSKGEILWTLEHEIWEVGFRALGYPVDWAHRKAIEMMERGAPLSELQSFPRNSPPLATSGPGAESFDDASAANDIDALRAGEYAGILPGEFIITDPTRTAPSVLSRWERQNSSVAIILYDPESRIGLFAHLLEHQIEDPATYGTIAAALEKAGAADFSRFQVHVVRGPYSSADSVELRSLKQQLARQGFSLSNMTDEDMRTNEMVTFDTRLGVYLPWSADVFYAASRAAGSEGGIGLALLYIWLVARSDSHQAHRQPLVQRSSPPFAGPTGPERPGAAREGSSSEFKGEADPSIPGEASEEADGSNSRNPQTGSGFEKLPAVLLAVILSLGAWMQTWASPAPAPQSTIASGSVPSTTIAEDDGEEYQLLSFLYGKKIRGRGDLPINPHRQDYRAAEARDQATRDEIEKKNGLDSVERLRMECWTAIRYLDATEIRSDIVANYAVLHHRNARSAETRLELMSGLRTLLQYGAVNDRADPFLLDLIRDAKAEDLIGAANAQRTPSTSPASEPSDSVSPQPSTPPDVPNSDVPPSKSPMSFSLPAFFHAKGVQLGLLGLVVVVFSGFSVTSFGPVLPDLGVFAVLVAGYLAWRSRPRDSKMKIAVSGFWISLFIFGSYLDFHFLQRLVQDYPGLLLPALVPIGALNALVGKKLEEIWAPAAPPSKKTLSIAKLLGGYALYMTPVESADYTIAMRLLPIALYLVFDLVLSLVAFDPNADYILERLDEKTHEQALTEISETMPVFSIANMPLWLPLSCAARLIVNPIVSYSLLSANILFWTVQLFRFRRQPLNTLIQDQRNPILKMWLEMAWTLSRPLERLYRSRGFSLYMRYLNLVLIAIAADIEVGLCGVGNLLVYVLIPIAIGSLYLAWNYLPPRPPPGNHSKESLPVRNVSSPGPFFLPRSAWTLQAA